MAVKPPILTSSIPVTPEALPIPYGINHGLPSFLKVNDLFGSNALWFLQAADVQFLLGIRRLEEPVSKRTLKF